MSRDEIDMFDELFIPVAPDEMQLWIPPRSEEEYLSDLKTAFTPAEKIEAFKALVEIYRFNSSCKDQPNNVARRDHLISLFHKHASGDPKMTEAIGRMVMILGSHCEKSRDYRSALMFYEICQSYEMKGSDLRYFNSNNLGFCLNFVREFEKAERYLRAAIAIDANRYNAWKNLGVSLEHQSQLEEAAESYFRAVTLSGGEMRSTRHLKRLMERQSGLKRVHALQNFAQIRH